MEHKTTYNKINKWSLNNFGTVHKIIYDSANKHIKSKCKGEKRDELFFTNGSSL